MKRIKHSAVLFGASLLLLLSACGSNGTKSNDNSSTTATDTISNQSPEQTIVQPVKSVPENAVLYLDCSHSMKGYINTATDAKFKNVISSLLYWKPTKAYLFDTKEQPEISRDEFINLINTRKVSWSDESDLTKMIGSMVKKVNDGSVGISYLITDGIMSGSNQEVRESVDRSFNITSRGTLTARIADAVSACQDDVAILLIKYTSSFTGKYYCYTNVDQVDFRENQRPFYVVAIGNRKLVKELVDKTQKEELLSNNQGLLLLGDKYPYELSLKPSKKEGISVSRDKQIIVGTNIRSDDYVIFNGNLSNLPSYMLSTEYFEKNGEVYVQYSQKGEFKKLDAQYISYEIDGTTLNLGVQAKCIRRNAMYFKLKYELPSWVEMSSSDNDKNIKQSPIPKTFNLKYFVKGLAEINDDEYITKIDTLKFK
ncbi:MAG: hypothetical protein J6K43_10780 [Lachnospiraceae bacterium]|nr:hypothetical protein [Lachnospiraceae bacterium]